MLVSCSRSELDPDLFGDLPNTGTAGAGGSTTSGATSSGESVGSGRAGATPAGSTGVGGDGSGGSSTGAGDGGAAGSIGDGGATGSGGSAGSTGSGSGTGAGGANGSGGVAGRGGTSGSSGAGGATATGAGGAAGSAGSGGTAGSGGAPAKCGNGKVDPGEACDLGPRNADRPALVVEQAMASHAVLPVSRAATATAFYNYFSSSSHTGFEQVGAARMILHQDRATGALSLVVVLGIDQGTSGQAQPAGHATMSFDGLPRRVAVALSDDPGELYLTSPTTAQGDWHFDRNSDGGILSGLPFPGAWSVTVTPTVMSGLTSWQFIDDKGGTPLALANPITIEAVDSPSKCRTDCTVPRCGDGILDGGEVCDDGNTTNGDGCAGDCKSLF